MLFNQHNWTFSFYKYFVHFRSILSRFRSILSILELFCHPTTNDKSLWFNDSVSFFGLETKSNVIIFQHPFLVLKAAAWEELLAHKVHASRHDKDIQDAVRILQEIKGKDKETIYTAVKKYSPFTPHVPEPLLRKRFESVWSISQKR